MIEMIFSFYSIDSLDQAIIYMTKENGVWQHNYIESEEDTCIICNEKCDHIDFRSSIHSRTLDEEIDIRINEKPPTINLKVVNENFDSITITEESKSSGDEIVCSICFTISNEVYSLKCKHVFCSDCWKEYLLNLINEGKVIRLPCMQKDCDCNVDDVKVKELLGETIYNKYKKFQLNRFISTSKDLKFCPVINCGSYARKNIESKNVKCFENSHEFCFDCLKPVHLNRDCSEVD
jgi:hypothetical protein